MALILKKAIKGYVYAFTDLADPRVENFLFMSSPLYPTVIIIGYLYFVFNLGPEIMKNRKPFELDKLLIVYNLLQVITCMYLVVQGFRYTFFTYNWFCEPVDYSYDETSIWIARLAWMYFMMKVVDLLDTIFFVLRKKHSQVTFLHVYHHFGMAGVIWGAVKFVPGGHGAFMALTNCIVHTVMYSYYLLTAWDKEYKKSVWWKKHITQLQLAQFIATLLHFLQLLVQPDCKYPKWIVLFIVPQNLFLTVLFLDFYIKTYVKPKSKPHSLTEAQDLSKLKIH